MREELQKVFDVNRARLIKGLETVHSNLLSELLAAGVITGEQENTIKVILESNRRNDTLCDIMKRRKDADFDKFWNILWKDQEDLVLRCIPDFQPKEDMASNCAIQKSTGNKVSGNTASNNANAVASKSQESTEEKGLTNEVIKLRVQKHYPDIQPSLDPKGHVVNKLFGDGILTNAEFKTINDIDRKEERCDALFHILREKPEEMDPYPYIGLREALKKDYGYLVNVIDEIVPLDDPSYTCCKILESIVASYLIDYLNEHHLMNKAQHGFLRKHSTITNCSNPLMTGLFQLYILEEFEQATPNERIGNKVKKIYEKIQPSLDPKGHILNKLFGAEVLTAAEFKSLNSLKEKHDKTDQLYAILVDKPATANAFVHFREALQKDYSWVVKMIDE